MIPRSRALRGRAVLLAGLVAVLPRLLVGQTPAPVPAGQPNTGRIAGRVVDGGTGRPLSAVRVRVVGIVGVVESDLDGRFRTPPIAVGVHSVAAALIGYKPVQVDSIKVVAGQTATISIALVTAPIQLEELTVASDRPTRVSSSAGLLAAQQNAMAVVDGVSSEAIAKTPDSDAGQAVARVTGLTVVQDKVVVRGLSERYSSSLLNGVEVASPEPDKKFVPLDVFSAGLIESIVAAKTATPDRPGDFAGGLVDIQTKEFPDNFVFNVGLSQGFNSRSTFKKFARFPRSGSDYFAFDGRGRGIQGTLAEGERFAEGLSGIWTPPAQRARPNTGVSVAIGGRKDLGSDAFGYVMSVDYGLSRSYNPDRYDAQGGGPILFEDASERVELSGIFNLAYRLGSTSKFGFKNFYSRSSEEGSSQGVGGDVGDGPSLNYQARYVEQFVTQSQLTGDHLFQGLANSRLEWKASYGEAGRADLDNRQLRYFDGGSGFALNAQRPSFRGNTDLADKSYSGHLDYSLPFSLRSSGDALFKVGGAYRRKNRAFDATALELRNQGGLAADLQSLPPEQLLSPENFGPGLLEYIGATTVFPYDAREEVSAGYVLADFELLPAVRIVGGVRREAWTARLTELPTTDVDVELQPIRRNNVDWLWSANLTYSLSPTTNVRLAAYRTVTRPDLRELSVGGYPEVVGGYNTLGNPNLQQSKVFNADARFEVYPGAEELFAVSVFYKQFTQPLINTFVDAGGTFLRPDNADGARSYGAEFELRKSLAFLSGGLAGFLVNGNLTLLRSSVDMPSRINSSDQGLEFQGLSPYIVNAGVTYSGAAGFTASALINRFGQRIVRYGLATPGSTESPANTIERPRTTVDAKLKYPFGRHWSVSITGKNLFDSRSELSFDRATAVGIPLLGRIRNGVSISTGISYAH